MRSVAATVLLFSGLASAQVNLSAAPAKTKQYVAYAAEEQTLAAGKKSVLEIRFRVNDGYHVNSHTPKSELLIPTNLTLDSVAGVKAAPAEYPAGTAYSFSFEPNEKLDVANFHGGIISSAFLYEEIARRE